MRSKSHKQIDWQPGYWIDWFGKDGPVIRDAAGQIVATDLMVDEDDIERLKPKMVEYIQQQIARHNKQD